MEKDNKDNKIRISVKRHMWPDEIAAKRKERKNKLVLITSILFSLLIGLALGFKLSLNSAILDNSLSKIATIKSILETKWYYGTHGDISSEQIVDDAIRGMSNHEVDPHTFYMNSDELQEFTTSIDRNFVGIGVQYTAIDNYNVITQVFYDSPAYKAGVKAGDIIYSVDGTLVSDMENNDIKSYVTGESGTEVVIEFIRDNEHITKTLIRGEVLNTAYGEMIDENVGYLHLYQFGSSTGLEVRQYLDLMSQQGMKKLIIDLRDNGGGYLGSFVDVASYFVEKGQVIMQQEYSDGTIDTYTSNGYVYQNIEDIVILMNENTASASEVLIMALKENRDDVTLVGVNSYGKGSVQYTHTFTDGSALKYTTSIWKSKNGVWIDQVGIKPDVEVKLAEILYYGYVPMEENVVFKQDSVDNYVKMTQLALEFLGYPIKRVDGYFDADLVKNLKQFEKDQGLTIDGILSSEDLSKIMVEVTKAWTLDKQKDTQYQKAVEIINGTN